eukprot:CAMPEP_0194508394 /NCGR_PEP_ID=MMETSP0253-20130528/38588_1 /TAXON_ID=2966 /ORGANISM="Noctiluca scintillans" /LENGTH=30 /DNA_ID= /DNA_START= /DNA_END= /DNA_ORIENTATION=
MAAEVGRVAAQRLWGHFKSPEASAATRLPP